jgi:hypothetical protein
MLNHFAGVVFALGFSFVAFSQPVARPIVPIEPKTVTVGREDYPRTPGEVIGLHFVRLFNAFVSPAGQEVYYIQDLDEFLKLQGTPSNEALKRYPKFDVNTVSAIAFRDFTDPEAAALIQSNTCAQPRKACSVRRAVVMFRDNEKKPLDNVFLYVTSVRVAWGGSESFRLDNSDIQVVSFKWPEVRDNPKLQPTGLPRN